MEKAVIQAVITADIVNSTGLPPDTIRKLMKQLQGKLEPNVHEFYRGDSFQVLVKSPLEALSLLLQLRLIALRMSPERSMPVTDVRASLGIGMVKTPVRSLKTATDEAFVLSGRSFDKMRPDQRLVIQASEKNGTTNIGLRLLAHFLDYLFRRLTSKQAAVVYELIQKKNQVETARRLKKSQATVHKHAQSSGWPEMEKLLQEYSLLIDTIQ